MRTHRKLGLATKLMQATARQMVEVFGAEFCSLHVRETNEAAKHLYMQTLKFTKADVEEGYYGASAAGATGALLRSDGRRPPRRVRAPQRTAKTGGS